MSVRRALAWCSSCGLALSLALGCSGQTTVYEIFGAAGNAGAFPSGGAYDAGGAFAAGGERSNISGAGGVIGSGGLIAMAGASASAGSGATGVAGALAIAGAGGSAGSSAGGAGGIGGADGRDLCSTTADCPKPSSMCVVVLCVAGACEVDNHAPGNVSIADVPADCHVTTHCDAMGNGTLGVDQDNVPTPSNPCLAGTCNAIGTPGTEALPTGAPCTTASGGTLCDGIGNCVQCLHSRDCPLGLSCSASNQCVSAPCTDVDCGGVCPPCSNGKKCLRDTDCASSACDALGLTCIANQCLDQQQDGVETDADCGGGICTPCALGQGCLLSNDCTSQACDALKLICISNQCADHRQDGNESDVDCGGTVCPACAVGRKCRTGIDCPSGHICGPGNPHVCN